MDMANTKTLRQNTDKDTLAKLELAKQAILAPRSMNRQFYDTPAHTDAIESLVHRDDAFWASVKNMMYDYHEFSDVFDRLRTAIDTKVKGYIATENARLSTYLAPSKKLKDKYFDYATRLSVMGFLPTSSDSPEDRLWLPQNQVLDADTQARFINIPRYDLINGIALTKDILDSGKNPYQDRYATFITKHPDYKSEYNDTKAQVQALAKHRMILAISPKKQAEYTALKKQLLDKERVYDTVLEYRRNATTYANMTKDTKALLYKYLDTYDSLHSISQSITTHRDNTSRLQGRKKYTPDAMILIDNLIDEAIASLSTEDQAVVRLAPQRIAEILCSITGPELYIKKFDGNVYYPSHKTTPDNMLVDRIVADTKPIVADLINKHHGLYTPTNE